MPSERILIEFPATVDGSRELFTAAVRVAFWFSGSFPDRRAGIGNGAACVQAGHRWRVHWTKERAVSVRCVEEVPHAD